jgi:hypothetical protein
MRASPLPLQRTGRAPVGFAERIADISALIWESVLPRSLNSASQLSVPDYLTAGAARRIFFLGCLPVTLR